MYQYCISHQAPEDRSLTVKGFLGNDRNLWSGERVSAGLSGGGAEGWVVSDATFSKAWLTGCYQSVNTLSSDWLTYRLIWGLVQTYDPDSRRHCARDPAIVERHQSSATLVGA